jgi:hypothetical protein
MNTVTLIDLRDEDASSGNSMLSVVVQLSMGMGVASAAALLSGFTLDQSGNDSVLNAFQATFFCVGLLSMLAATIFLQLGDHDGGLAKDIDRKIEVEG